MIFVLYELFGTEHPVVDLKVFKLRTYATGVFLMTMLGFVLYGSLVLLPILLQTLWGYPALQAGIAMAPRGLGSFIAMPIVGIIMVKFDPRKLLTIGMIVASFTLFQLSWLNLTSGYWDVFWPQLIQGISLALLFVPLTTVTMDPIPKEKMGNATSIFNLMRNIGGSGGIANVTTVVARHTQMHINDLGAHVNSYNMSSRMTLTGLASMFTSRGMDPVSAAHGAYDATFGMVAQQAAMLSFVDAFWLLGITFLLIIPLIYIMKKPHGHGEGLAAH